MNSKRRCIQVGSISVEIVRKDIKNLHIGVYPPYGRVRVAVPLHLDDEAVRLAAVSRLGWIRRQQEEFEQQDRQSEREMVTGESHYFQGRRYRLDVVVQDGPTSVRLANNRTIQLQIRAKDDNSYRRRVLHQWYREHLKKQIPALLAKWEPRVGVSVAEVRIKKMKTRWGSCNSDARRVWLNLELAKKPVTCLEYILVHEMVHILERHHNEHFRELMNRLMPKWQSIRDELNRVPVAHENWRY